MSDWPVVPLKDIAEFANGANFTKESFGSGLKIIGVRDFADRLVPDWTSADEVMRSALSSDRQLLSEGDLLFVRSNGNPALVGRCLLVTAGPEATHSAFTIRAHPDRARVLPRFLAYFMRHAHRAGCMTAANGTNITNLNQGILGGIPVSLPDLATQHSVVAVLQAIDDLIETDLRRVELLERMARAIYREWFVHFRYPGHEDDTLVDSPLGWIPGGWTAGTVGELVELVKATIDPTTVPGDTPAVGLEHIPRRRLTLDAWGNAGELGSRKAVFHVDDILFGKIRPYFHKVCVAPIGGVCSTDAIVLRPVQNHWGFAVHTIAGDEFVANATQTSNGTKMPRADWKVIKDFPVAIPPADLSQRFTEVASDAQRLANVLMFESRGLRSIRDLLLPRLVTGKIDVSSLDLDAPVEGSA